MRETVIVPAVAASLTLPSSALPTSFPVHGIFPNLGKRGPR
jgi:hypothetical protein